jgi:hypothetical protein
VPIENRNVPCLLGLNIRTSTGAYLEEVEQRAAVDSVWDSLLGPVPQMPVDVRLTRIAPAAAPSMSEEELREALAIVRQQVAQRLSAKGDDGRVTWSYAEEQALSGDSESVVVEIRGPTQ